MLVPLLPDLSNLRTAGRALDFFLLVVSVSNHSSQGGPNGNAMGQHAHLPLKNSFPSSLKYSWVAWPTVCTISHLAFIMQGAVEL